MSRAICTGLCTVHCITTSPLGVDDTPGKLHRQLLGTLPDSGTPVLIGQIVDRHGVATPMVEFDEREYTLADVERLIELATDARNRMIDAGVSL